MVSTFNRCISISNLECCEEEELKSSHEEADTKFILHAKHVATHFPSPRVVLRSHSGDTDIIVLAVALLQEYRDRIMLDDGSGKSRRTVKLNDVDLDEDVIGALIGFHAFTGNDYCSSFFRKGKETCFKVMQRKSNFSQAFSRVGTEWDLPDDLFKELEIYVCSLYGSNSKDINKARYLQFKKKFSNEEKAIDMATLAPCKPVLVLQVKKANYVACIWKRSGNQHIYEPPFSSHGWDPDGRDVWVEEAYPDEITEILFEPEYDNDGTYGAEIDMN